MQGFERSPANLVRMDNNNFVLTVPSSQSGADAVSQEQLVELEKDPHAEHQVMPSTVRVSLTQLQSSRWNKGLRLLSAASFPTGPQPSAGACTRTQVCRAAVLMWAATSLQYL